MAAPNLLLLRIAEFLRLRKGSIIEDSASLLQEEHRDETEQEKNKNFPWRARLEEMVQETADRILKRAAVTEGQQENPALESLEEDAATAGIKCLLLQASLVRNTFLRALNKFQAEQANTKGFTAIDMTEARQEAIQEFDRLINVSISRWIANGGKAGEKEEPSTALRELHGGMMAVLGLLRLTLEKVPPASRVHISAAAQQLGRLGMQLQEIAGIETDSSGANKPQALASSPPVQRREPLRIAPLDVAAFVRTVGEAFRPAAERKGLRFDTRCGPAPQIIHTDAAKLHRAISLLLDHSIAFTDSGSINFSAGLQSSTYWAMTVKDSSPGIPPEVLSNVLLGLAHAPDESHGLGKAVLGIALARDLAEILGCVLEAESKAGDGTQFRLLLPVN